MDKKISYIKVLDPMVAKELVANGFLFIKEQINHQDVYAFIPNAELLAFLQKQYKNQCFVFENKLRF